MKQTTNFPYNVIIPSNKFEFTESNSTDVNYYYQLDIPQMILVDEELQDLNEYLKLVAEVNCSSTIYREIFESSELEKIKIQIPKSKVYNSFTIDVLILAKEDLHWHNQNIRKGMPIAHLGSHNVQLIASSQGLITFIPDDTTDNVKYSLTSDQIQIIFPTTQYNWLLHNQNNPIVKHLLSSQFAQIALIKACSQIKDESNDHLMWLKELKNKWKKYSGEEKEFPEDNDIIPFINSILKNPSESLISYLMKNLNENE